MNILPYEKVIAEFKPWQAQYLSVAEALINFISTAKLQVIHFGSTSAKVGGKGIIDLSILYPRGQIQLALDRLQHLGFQDQVSDQPFPAHRPRKDGAVLVDGIKYCIHVHVIERDSDEHNKQLQYKAFLLQDPEARTHYEHYKKTILAKGVTEQEAYAKQKAPFVKSVLATLA
jgi:GrpB-like predicted nucleotidyltransferase (UPF0157 family)